MDYQLCLLRQNQDAIRQQTPEPQAKQKQQQSINSWSILYSRTFNKIID